MSGESPLFVKTWPVGQFTATLTVPRAARGAPAAAVIEWAPHVPQRLTDAELSEYRAGRARAMADLARLLGGSVALVEV